MSRASRESALSRWSRRKLEAQQALEAEHEAVTADQIETGAPPAASADEETAPVLTDADMPPLDSLTEESDFSPFMSPGVSDELRNLALRKLFRSSVFNIRDGLDEYDEDYTSFEKLGGIITSDMKHQIEMQQRELREKLAAESDRESAARADVAGDDEDDSEEDFDDEDYADDDEEIVAEFANRADKTQDD